MTKEKIQKILATGANVILTTGGIDDLCLKYFVEAGAMAVRRCKKQDLKRIAKATGGKEKKQNKSFNVFRLEMLVRFLFEAFVVIICRMFTNCCSHLYHTFPFRYKE